MAQAKNNRVSTGAKVGIGAGMAALAAAAGAFYFYGSKHATTNRKQMKGWMIKAKGELVERMEKMKDMSQDQYDAAIKQVTSKYGKMKNVNPEDLKALAADLSKHWKNISAQMKGPGKKKVVRAKRVK